MPKNLNDDEIMARAISRLCRQFSRSAGTFIAETHKYVKATTIDGLNRILPRKLEELVDREGYRLPNTNQEGTPTAANEAETRPETLRKDPYN